MTIEGQSSKKDAAYHAFKQRIIDFTFAPGTTLTEEFLASTFKISRTPIRDAVLKLEKDGLVVRESKGIYITKLSLLEVIDTYMVREALEKCAAAQCVERASDEELNSIRESVLSYSDDKAQPENVVALNEKFLDFHLMVIRAANNDILLKQYENISDRIRIITRMYMSEEFSIEYIRERHLRIIDALIERNTLLAQALINSSIMGVVRYLSGVVK